MKILTKLLKDTSLTTFLEKHFTRLPLSIQGGANSYTSYLDWDVVKQVIEEDKSVLRVVKDGKMVKDHAAFKFLEAKAFYDQGNTLLFKNTELSHPHLRSLSRDFAESFHTEVDIQLYCTPSGHNAFGWHYDVEEVFIIQAKGSKLYSIRQNTIHPYPLVTSIPKDLAYEKQQGEIGVKVLLKEGDFLYIPSGWWHKAETQEESMHISIGLMPRSAVDIASFLPKYLSQFPFWRTRMPLHQKFKNKDEEIEFYQEAVTKIGQDLSTKMSDPKFVEEFLKFVKKES